MKFVILQLGTSNN